MKALNTNCHFYETKTKEDILRIGIALRVFIDSTYFNADDGILPTWKKAYDNNEVIYDIKCIAQVLRVIKEEFNLPWREK